MPFAIDFTDATETEHREPLLPSLVHRFEDVGFRVLGRVATTSPPSSADLQFDRAERARLNAWRSRPAFTLLAATDETAYASVDTYGDAPLLRLRTELEDGCLVETIGLLPAGTLRTRRGIDPFASFTSTNALGRSVRLLQDSDPSVVVSVHIEHVHTITSSRGSRPCRHNDRGDAIRLWTRAAAHAVECGHRLTRWSRLLGLSAFLACGLIALLILVPTLVWLDIRSVFFSVVLGLLSAGLALAIGLPPTALMRRRLNRAKWWRPDYPLRIQANSGSTSQR